MLANQGKKRTTISALNVTITGNLSIEDVNNPTRNGRFKDNYTLINVSLGQFFTLDLGYDEFDAYLQLINADTGNVIASDDDGGPGINSQLSFTAENGINYLVRVTSFRSGAIGQYILSTRACLQSQFSGLFGGAPHGGSATRVALNLRD